MFKSGKLDIIEYIPINQRTDPKPFTVYFRPMTKEQYDSYTNSLGEFKRNKFISHAQDAFRLLCEKVLEPNVDGVYLKNVVHDGKALDNVKDKPLAITMLCGLQDVDSANEIELEMKSQSTLNGEEEKN